MKLTHGLYLDPTTGKKSRLYHIWEDMKSRCHNPKNKRFADYGGRGIYVNDLWRNDFKAFHDWAMLNGYAHDLTLDRIRVNEMYTPDNCKWSTPKEQGNNRRTNVLITFRGETKTRQQWCDELGVATHTLKNRLSRGWSIERAFSEPEKPKS